MKKIHIDLETFSSTDLSKCGVYKYVEAVDHEILLFAYSVDDGEVKVIDLAQGEMIPDDIMDALEDESVIKYAHNANFERINLSRYLGYPSGEYLSPASWRCTMTWAAYLGMPLSLAGVGAVLGLDKQKMEEGKELIRYFCVPCNPTKSNGGRTRNRPEDAPDKWALFKKYNKRDVEVEMEIEQKLLKFPVPEFVWDEYHIDQEINDRGVALDLVLVSRAIKMDGEVREELKERMRKITELENPNSVQQLVQWLGDNGLEVDSLGKKDVKKLIEVVDGDKKEVLMLRQQLAKSSVKKYQAMQNAVCEDGRARGMFMFYGAMRTGRFSGRLIQMQNLPQNHLSDLAEARELVRRGDLDAVKMLYEDVPDTLSQLIRTAFIPCQGSFFYVADFSAIEARVLAWLAGEQWVLDTFAAGGDIYCATASRMFGVPVEKHGVNGELRQKGKQATLSCIAEGSRVLTDKGLVPIEDVTLEHKLWDGENWVEHEGVVYKGEREVIDYEGLTATEDHLVWIEGKSEPVQFGIAASSGAHLVQTGDGGRAIRLGENNKSRETMEQNMESQLCSDQMSGVRCDSMAVDWKSKKGQVKGMPVMLSAKKNSEMVRQETHCCKEKMRESEGTRIPELWRKRDKVRVPECDGSWAVFDKGIWCSGQIIGNRQDRYQWKLRTGQCAICDPKAEPCEPQEHGAFRILTGILAILRKCGNQKTVGGKNERGNHTGSGTCSAGETKKLADNKRTARLYDIRNAGPYHRFTVSGKLVHNCGYGGGVGALIAMGAIESGMNEDELQPLVDAWRQANPNIVRLWGIVDRAAKTAIKERTTININNLTFSYQSGFLFITLPSGRTLAYVKPRMGENRFGGESITYEGVGATKKWERLETFGGKLVENIVQAISRDILLYSMKTLRCTNICMHIHDELVIEGSKDMSLEAVCEQMGRVPPWAPGLVLRADGYVTPFYCKDN